MSTILSIKIGAAPAVSISFSDDAKATALLTAAWSEFIGEPVDATNADKLRALLRRWIAQDARRLKQKYVEDNREALEAAAAQQYDLGES